MKDSKAGARIHRCGLILNYIYNKHLPIYLLSGRFFIEKEYESYIDFVLNLKIKEN